MVGAIGTLSLMFAIVATYMHSDWAITGLIVGIPFLIYSAIKENNDVA